MTFRETTSLIVKSNDWRKKHKALAFKAPKKKQQQGERFFHFTLVLNKYKDIKVLSTFKLELCFSINNISVIKNLRQRLVSHYFGFVKINDMIEVICHMFGYNNILST